MRSRAGRLFSNHCQRTTSASWRVWRSASSRNLTIPDRLYFSPAKLDLGRGGQFAVLGLQLRFPHQVLLDGRVEGHHVGFPQGEGLLAELLFQLAAVRAGQQDPLDPHIEVGQLGRDFVAILAIRFVLLVAGVLIEPQMDERRPGFDLAPERIPAAHDRRAVRGGLGSFQIAFEQWRTSQPGRRRLAWERRGRRW